VQQPVRALQVDGADLFDHAVEVVDSGQPGEAAEGLAKGVAVHGLRDQPLPASAVEEDALAEVGSGAAAGEVELGCGAQALPDQAGEAEGEERGAAVAGQPGVELGQARLLLLIQQEEVVAAEGHHPQDAGGAGGDAPLGAQDGLAVDDQHWQAGGAQQGPKRAGEGLGLGAGGGPIEHDAAWGALGAAAAQLAKDLLLGHAEEAMALEEADGEPGELAQPAVGGGRGVEELQQAPVGLAALPVPVDQGPELVGERLGRAHGASSAGDGSAGDGSARAA